MRSMDHTWKTMKKAKTSKQAILMSLNTPVRYKEYIILNGVPIIRFIDNSGHSKAGDFC